MSGMMMMITRCSYGGQPRELAGTENKYLEIALEDVLHNSSSNIQDIYSGLTEVHAMDHPKLDTEHTHAHMDHNHLDPSLMVFFTLKDLKVGKRMAIHFPRRDPANSPKLWPREEADSVPFSSNQLPNLLKLFSFSSDSSQATAMENTLRECESKPIKGEPRKWDRNRVYRVSLAGENGDRVEARVVCHLDTSQWAPSHVSFQVLGITPGSSSVCHFFPADHLIWLPKLKAHVSSSM
ncbi:hypothetical protein JHK87_008612 [Glycine soja]|nr:hypothetical protein JHK87_008612 [Glycine soja]